MLKITKIIASCSELFLLLFSIHELFVADFLIVTALVLISSWLNPLWADILGSIRTTGLAVSLIIFNYPDGNIWSLLIGGLPITFVALIPSLLLLWHNNPDKKLHQNTSTS